MDNATVYQKKAGAIKSIDVMFTETVTVGVPAVRSRIDESKYLTGDIHWCELVVSYARMCANTGAGLLKPGVWESSTQQKTREEIQDRVPKDMPAYTRQHEPTMFAIALRNYGPTFFTDRTKMGLLAEVIATLEGGDRNDVLGRMLMWSDDTAKKIIAGATLFGIWWDTERETFRWK